MPSALRIRTDLCRTDSDMSKSHPLNTLHDNAGMFPRELGGRENLGEKLQIRVCAVNTGRRDQKEWTYNHVALARVAHTDLTLTNSKFVAK